MMIKVKEYFYTKQRKQSVKEGHFKIIDWYACRSTQGV